MKCKKFLLLLFAAILSTNIFSQFDITKQKDIGGSNDDAFTCMDLTKDGGLIAGGYSYSDISGDKTQNSRGFNDYWIIKLNKSKKIQWDKTIGGSDIEKLNAIQQTSDGGYILAGSSGSNISGDKTENNKGSLDYWIIKLDSSGNINGIKQLEAAVMTMLNL